ncbi:hypothetical protein B932_0531 [Gluconobacter oxydans H24]|nr:hypothetical protein B932_0531 [Gluconobacter oxydans H24]
MLTDRQVLVQNRTRPENQDVFSESVCFVTTYAQTGPSVHPP